MAKLAEMVRGALCTSTILRTCRNTLDYMEDTDKTEEEMLYVLGILARIVNGCGHLYKCDLTQLSEYIPKITEMMAEYAYRGDESFKSFFDSVEAGDISGTLFISMYNTQIEQELNRRNK